MNKIVHNIAVFGCLTIAGLAARQALEKAWEVSTDKPAPKDPAAPGVGWKEALLWGATAGVLAGLVRTTVRRGYAELSGSPSAKTKV